ncbi:MAG: MBL fold metallo-hydrolase [Ruminococcus sp.]|nr:MBL fold metallo-hydrolase [Candidatus Apopatosoma intestinale]
MATKKLTNKQKNWIKQHPILTVLLVAALIVGSYFLGLWDFDIPGSDIPVITPTAEVSGKLQVHYIDVGQADSILIIAPTGETMLIDAGASNDKDVRAVKGADYLINYLKSHGVTKLDYLMLTHPHSDHIASADEVIAAYAGKIGTILLSDDESSGWSTVAKAMQKAGETYDLCSCGETYRLGECTFKILGPVDSSVFDDSERNHYSIVCRLTFGETSFMFTGDAETVTESAILKKFKASDLKSDVLKVGHHGSTTSSSASFLNAVGADLAVICVGSENGYGHPHDKIVDRLTEKGYQILRTDKEGTIVLVSDGKSVSRLK